MDTPLPSNQDLLHFSQAFPWDKVEDIKRRFNAILQSVADQTEDGPIPLDKFSEAVGVPVTTYYDSGQSNGGNVVVAEYGGQKIILGSIVSSRYRSGKTATQSIVPYNLNPSVNHTNLQETEDSNMHIRAMGAELELGLLHPDGRGPTETEMHAYMDAYQEYARRLGIKPQVDREACQYQIEAHVAPGIGYYRARNALEGIMAALAASSESTGLQTAMLSAYPIESDFKLTDDPKVHTAVDLMKEVNNVFPEYGGRLDAAKARYHISPESNVIETFRLQGCHIHLDLAGRSEALGLLSFYTLLRSATAVANSAVLKGGPFVNGTCDAELMCTREYLRQTTVTGRTIEIPLSPHLKEGDLEKYANLLKIERANAMARALLYDDSLGSPISAMHSLLGRMRPDLTSTKRICTLESTGMPINISASRQAAVLTDFEFSQVLIENYFRKYGCDLEPMYEDQTLWALIGPLDSGLFAQLHAESDRVCSDMLVTTAVGTQMSLGEFYEMKRIYMHKHLTDIAHISPRDIDEVYTSLQRMLDPPSGQAAQTVEDYIYNYKLRSTGNWGQILLNTFEEEGGVRGKHQPDVVLRVVSRINEAIRMRYLTH